MEDKFSWLTTRYDTRYDSWWITPLFIITGR